MITKCKEAQTADAPKPEKKRNDAIWIVLIVFGALALIMTLPCVVALLMSWFWVDTRREEIAARNLQADKVRLEQQLQQERETARLARLEAERIRRNAREAALRQKGQGPAIAAADRRHAVQATVNTEKTDPAKYLCVRLRVLAADGQVLQEIQTAASVLMKWAMGWHGSDTIVLYSSDVGPSAWKETGAGTWEPVAYPLPAEIKKRSEELRQKKYGAPVPPEDIR